MKKYKDVPIISATLVIINVIVFIICTFTGDLLYNMGELGIKSVLLRKEYGRILYAMFLHGDINHIFNNMIILFFLGAMIEKEVGHFTYAVFYFLSGVGGNIISLIWKTVSLEPASSIGASGAVFGLDGVLLAMVLFAGHRMENVTAGRVILMITYSLYSGFTGDNIDNAAHLGGLFTGFILGFLKCMMNKIQENRKREV